MMTKSQNVIYSINPLYVYMCIDFWDTIESNFKLKDCIFLQLNYDNNMYVRSAFSINSGSNLQLRGPLSVASLTCPCPDLIFCFKSPETTSSSQHCDRTRALKILIVSFIMYLSQDALQKQKISSRPSFLHFSHRHLQC